VVRRRVNSLACDFPEFGAPLIWNGYALSFANRPRFYSEPLAIAVGCAATRTKD
jgi:hypothetical protein